jgi:hypothetical protein
MANNGTKTPGGMTAREQRIAAAVAAGKTQREIAAEIGKSLRTVARALESPSVRAEINRIHKCALEAGVMRLSAGFHEAVGVLEELSKSGKPSDSIRLGAARCIVDGAVKVRDGAREDEILDRLRALEQKTGVIP